MSHHRTIALISAIMALSLAVLACGGGVAATATPPPAPTNTRPAPTATSEPTEAPTAAPTTAPTQGAGIVAGDVSISSISAYVDEYDYVHIVGLLFNDTERAVTDIELTLELVDGSGTTVLTDFDDQPVASTTFSPFLWTIGPGETTPFDYTVYTDGRDPNDWEYTVTVSDFSSGRVSRGDLEVVNDQLTKDQYGTIYITGELVNLNDEPVLVNGLAAALLDDADTALAADASYSFTRYLEPAGSASGADRTPFSISLDGPADNATSYFLYWDADLTDPSNAAAGLTIQLANAYADEFDDMHVVGAVTNNGSQLLSVQMVAGLYDADGVVLDAATAWLPVYVGPGETIPFSFDYFSSVNTNPDELARVDSYTIQIDAYGTYPTTFEVVRLDTANEDSETSGEGQVTFTGEVVNDSGKALSSAYVLLALYDAEDKLRVTNWTSVYPSGDVIADGDSLPFELTLWLPPGVDTSSWTFATYVQGYVD